MGRCGGRCGVSRVRSRGAPLPRLLANRAHRAHATRRRLHVRRRRVPERVVPARVSRNRREGSVARLAGGRRRAVTHPPRPRLSRNDVGGEVADELLERRALALVGVRDVVRVVRGRDYIDQLEGCSALLLDRSFWF